MNFLNPQLVKNFLKKFCDSVYNVVRTIKCKNWMLIMHRLANTYVSLCIASKISLDHLFIVLANHEVDIGDKTLYVLYKIGMGGHWSELIPIIIGVTLFS